LLRPGDQLKMGAVSLLVIGPKVESAQAELNEDATVFMPAVKPARPAVKPQVSQVAAVNPARAQAPVAEASVAETKSTSVVWLGVALLVGCAIVLWALL
jgi:hypothetical protein